MFELRSAAQQRPVFIVLSVQFAADSTSLAAPRTVLHAASATHAPATASTKIFDRISTLLTSTKRQCSSAIAALLPPEQEAVQAKKSPTWQGQAGLHHAINRGSLAVAAVDGVFGAVGDGVHVARPGKIDAELLADPAGMRREEHDAVPQAHRLANVVGDEDDGLPALAPDPSCAERLPTQAWAAGYRPW